MPKKQGGETKKVSMNSFKVDFLATAAIGVIAASLSFFIIANLKTEIPAIISEIPFLAILLGFVVLCVMGIIMARAVGHYLPMIYQIGKFAETGGLNFLTDLGVYNLLIFLTNSTEDLYLSIFKAASFVVAVTNSYFWNKLWVFVKKDKSKEETASEFGKFIAVSIGGLLISIGVTYLVAASHDILAPQVADKPWANVAAIAAALTAMFWNFVGYKLFVFKK